ncbi:MAG: general secretion pathway protein GspB [Candidatus Omnitrophica bacterium]|nr:general secretion pathway protein GspB [Candidatus Omnitrophota bacterium]MBU4472719.1 general secretion pathway protein GspB [Candidatus Omnitrophota bacterium]MCG2706396.1 general secretion pathway protein GspB [Candidatus Omnitrophota bacterium]
MSVKNKEDRYILPQVFSSVICIMLISSIGFAQEQFLYDAKGKRDPFISLVTSDGRLLKLEQETTEGLLLEGIIYDKGGLSYAIVNGAVVKIGDKINEYQLLKIEEDKVAFIKDGQTLELELKEGE